MAKVDLRHAIDRYHGNGNLRVRPSTHILWIPDSLLVVRVPLVFFTGSSAHDVKLLTMSYVNFFLLVSDFWFEYQRNQGSTV